MPRRIARARKPATQWAKAGDCAAKRGRRARGSRCAERGRKPGAAASGMLRAADRQRGDSRHGGIVCCRGVTQRLEPSRNSARGTTASVLGLMPALVTDAMDLPRLCGLARSAAASSTLAGGVAKPRASPAAMPRRRGASGWRRRVQDHRQLDGNRRRRLARFDLGAAAADQPLIGRDQRHVRIDPDPADPGEHLNVEMKVVRGAVLDSRPRSRPCR